MISPDQVFLYLGAALVLALTPGPGIFYVAARTLAGGRAEGIASSIGTGLGGLVHVVAGAAGISALVLASAELFTMVKLAGAAYLIWLGGRTILAARRVDQHLDTDSQAVGPRRAFREGALVEALNPKTAAFFLAFVPQFIDPAAGNVAVQFIALSCISVLLNTLVDVAVALGASRARALAQSSLLARLQRASGAAMMALGIGLAFARRPAN